MEDKHCEHPYIGKDNITGVAQLRIGKKLIDQALQLFYSLKLHCENIKTANEDEKKNELNPSSTGYCQKGIVAEIEKWRLKDIAIEEDHGDIW